MKKSITKTGMRQFHQNACFVFSVERAEVGRLYIAIPSKNKHNPVPEVMGGGRESFLLSSGALYTTGIMQIDLIYGIL